DRLRKYSKNIGGGGVVVVVAAVTVKNSPNLYLFLKKVGPTKSANRNRPPVMTDVKSLELENGINVRRLAPDS
uniref:Uncharacterized protein n=1 Tax=Romanomermis culicivorax TaxID=13658 RepID=A0A915HS79_ROMCU